MLVVQKFVSRNFILLFLVYFLTGNAHAQLASGIPHSFSVSGAPVAFPAGFTNIFVTATPFDDSTFFISPAGFNFNFAGTPYSKLVISTNGWLALVPAAIAVNPLPTSAQSLPTNQLSNNTTGYPVIAPLWDDHSSNYIRYVMPAATPNVLWVLWSVKWQKTHAAGASPLFWVRMDGNTGVINFYYSAAAYTPQTPSASIGIAGICPGDFYSVRTSSNTAATVDSITENTTIGPTGGPAPNFRPINCTYTFTPIANSNDNCAGARDLIPGTTCNYITATTYSSTPSGLPLPCTPDVNDVWFKFIKPSGATNVTITTAPAVCQTVGTTVEVLDGCSGTSLGCSTTSVANPNYGEVSLVRSCPAETLWVRVTGDANVEGRFRICVTYVGGNGSTCTTPNLICALPYSYTGTTAGSGNDYDSTTAVCHTKVMNGEDYVFAYTPATNQCIEVTLTSAGSNPGLFVYQGCPNAVGAHCLASSEFTTGSGTISSVALSAGVTYYIVVDNDTIGGVLNNPFSLNVISAGTAAAYDICSGAVNLGTIINGVNCTPQTFSTECSTPTAIGQAGLPSCVPANAPPQFIDGVTGDVWFRFTAGYSGSLQINTYKSAVNSTANAAMAIYNSGVCPSSAAAPYACDYNSGVNGMPSLSIPIVNGTTYYIRVWTENPENQGNFDICFQSACTPVNDLPCQAVFLPLGSIASGFNTCAGSTGEPANTAQCVAGGTINTVWYMTQVPASGQVRVRTHPLTLTDTQIQGYTFAAGCNNAASTNTPFTCNDDGVACSGGFNDFSDQIYTGLTPGDTLYIAVDGVNSQTGSFDITIIDGISTVFPPVYQQDCGAPQIVCSTADIVVDNPGYRNYGNICDMPAGYGCWGIGERNSIWYQFSVDPALSGGTATVSFSVATLASVDIDLIMWDITGVSNPCLQIQSLSLPIASCNFAGSSASTGLSTTIPLPNAFSNAITFSGPPRTYLLLLNNYNSSNNAGFTLDWNNTPISTTATNSVWSGFSDTLYTTNTNWGECGSTPSCAADATINNTPNGRQPTVDVGLPAKSVKNLVINAGAQLRIKSGATLSICGNLTNLGTLICEPGSIVQFVGTGVQTITGTLTGSSSFANLVINKPSGSVQLSNNIDVTENFTVSNATSVFNINGRYMKVGGDFTNYNSSTFIGITASTVEFNGTANQNYTNTFGQDTLFMVRMNKPTGKLFLNGTFSNLILENTLTLTSGNIVTTPVLEVNIRLNNVGAITGHSSNSYVEGRLRRRVVNFVVLEFPVGDPLVPNPASGNGYQLATINYTTSTVIPDILVWFNLWPGAVPNGPAASECVFATYDALPILNNGYWTFQKSVANFNGTYGIVLHNTGFTNNIGSAGWTVAKAGLSDPPLVPGSWTLLGNCFIPSTLAMTRRDLINSPATAATSLNHLYATVQSTQPLPIELLYFNAEHLGDKVLCNWETASETNNDYFEVERSDNGNSFDVIGKVSGFGPGISSESRTYSITDADHCYNTRYYRLKQVDIDGRNSYSETVAVNCNVSQKDISIFPNPSASEVFISFYESDDCIVKFQWLDVLSKQVKEEIHQVKKGYNSIQCDVSDLSTGIYYLQMKNISGDSDAIKRQIKFLKN